MSTVSLNAWVTCCTVLLLYCTISCCTVLYCTTITAYPTVHLCYCTGLSFLYVDYEAKFWYWEIIETFRRLTLTAVLSVVSKDDGVKLVFGILVTIVFAKVC